MVVARVARLLSRNYCEFGYASDHRERTTSTFKLVIAARVGKLNRDVSKDGRYTLFSGHGRHAPQPDKRLQTRRTARGQRPTTPIRQFLFDLGGVLYDDSAWRRWLLHLVAHMGLHTSYSAFFRVWDREFQEDVWRGKFGFWPALKRFLMTAGLSPGQVDEVEAACRARFRQFDQDIRPFPSVAATLHRISASGCAATVVSHAPLSVDEVSARLAELGLSDCITEVGYGDAAARHGLDVFQRFAQQHCRVPEEAAYVGRDPLQLAAAGQAHLQNHRLQSRRRRSGGSLYRAIRPAAGRAGSGRTTAASCWLILLFELNSQHVQAPGRSSCRAENRLNIRADPDPCKGGRSIDRTGIFALKFLSCNAEQTLADFPVI